MSVNQEISELPIGATPETDWLAAAGFLAVLAFPENYKRRDALVLCARAYVIKLGIKGKRVPKRVIRSEFRQYPERTIWQGPIRTAARIITQHRLPAADAALGIMTRQAWRNTRLQLELTHAGVSLKSVCNASAAFGAETRARTQGRAAGVEGRERLRGGAADARDTNWISRTWSASRPVLHLALALHAVLEESPESDLWSLIDTPTWVRTALERAEIFRCALLPSVRALRYDMKRAIVLRAENPARSETI